MRLFYNILILLSLFIFGCSGSNQEVDKTTLLIAGLSAEYPPFEFQQQGQIVGFDVDLIKAVGQELGKTVEIRDMSFHNLIPALQKGKIDVAISGLTITAERQKNVDFSKQYYQNTLAILYLKDKPQPQVGQFNDKKLGVQLGSTMEKWAKTAIKEAKNAAVVALDTNPALIEKLKHQQIDYVVVEAVQAIEFCKANPSLAFSKIGVITDGYGIALAKGSPLLKDINNALEALEQKGVLQELQKKWISV